MTAIHVICALITLGYWVWAQRKEYLEHKYAQITLGTLLVIVLLMLAGLWGLLLTIVAEAEERWDFLNVEVFSFHHKEESDEEVEGDDKAGE